MGLKMYFLLTRDQQMLAKGLLEGGTEGQRIQLKVIEGDPEQAASQQTLCLMSSEAEETPVLCRVERRRGEHIELSVIMTLNPELRNSYRVAADFDTFLYPVDGLWQGRRRVKAADMSCGGIAFYGGRSFHVKETAEIVIPNLLCPVIVKIRILRKELLGDGRYYYCSEFLYTCREEEQAVCQSVFGIQGEYRRSGAEMMFSI